MQDFRVKRVRSRRDKKKEEEEAVGRREDVSNERYVVSFSAVN